MTGKERESLDMDFQWNQLLSNTRHTYINATVVTYKPLVLLLLLSDSLGGCSRVTHKCTKVI
jgi:hypothetical protein